MTAWMKERDRLVEQTLAFVQRVAAANPIAAARSTPDMTQLPVPTEQKMAPVPLGQVAVPKPAAALRPVAVEPPQKVLKSFVSERADIIDRVAAFRAHQGKLIRERADYYDAMKARIQTDLRTDKTD